MGSREAPLDPKSAETTPVASLPGEYKLRLTAMGDDVVILTDAPALLEVRSARPQRDTDIPVRGE